jgi:hypothetical protein
MGGREVANRLPVSVLLRFVASAVVSAGGDPTDSDVVMAHHPGGFEICSRPEGGPCRARFLGTVLSSERMISEHIRHTRFKTRTVRGGNAPAPRTQE